MKDNLKTLKNRMIFIALVLVLLFIIIWIVLWRNNAIIENSSSKQTPILIPGLVLYYPFTGNANDMSGNNIIGEVQGAVPTNDRFGEEKCAYYFDGIDDSIIFDAIKMPIGLEPRTISAWIKADSFPPPAPQLPQIGSRATVIGWGRDDIAQLSVMDIVDNKLIYHVYNLDTNGSNLVEINKWYHLVIVYSEQTTFLYVNGVSEESKSQILNTATLRGRIGAFPDQTMKSSLFPNGYDMSYFHGIIDDIRIYDIALTTEQVLLLYHENGWK
jgi:hypothetical protein